MTVYIALLRGINVGGKRMKMDDLRDVFAELGFENVQTLLASGNVAFQSDASDRAQVAAQIEAGIRQKFGFESRIIIRTAEEIQQVIQNHPFSEDHMADEGKLLVMFMGEAPSSEAVTALKEAHAGPEVTHISGPEAYIVYPDGMGRSKLTNNFIEKHLKVTGTGRNWKTVNKLRDLADSFK